MSVRSDEIVNHVRIRGTFVSTSMVAPSLLHVSVVESFGLPGYHGNVIVDNYTVYIRYNERNTDTVSVWASKNESTSYDEICQIL